MTAPRGCTCRMTRSPAHARVPRRPGPDRGRVAAPPRNSRALDEAQRAASPIAGARASLRAGRGASRAQRGRARFRGRRHPRHVLAPAVPARRNRFSIRPPIACSRSAISSTGDPNRRRRSTGSIMRGSTPAGATTSSSPSTPTIRSSTTCGSTTTGGPGGSIWTMRRARASARRSRISRLPSRWRRRRGWWGSFTRMCRRSFPWDRFHGAAARP